MAWHLGSVRLWAMVFVLAALAAFAVVTFDLLAIRIRKERSAEHPIHLPPALAVSGALASYAKPIVISIVTGHYLGTFGYNTATDPRPPCVLAGVTLNCTLEDTRARIATADALWHHMPHVSSNNSIVPRKHPAQLLIGMSMESSAYYPHQANKDYTKYYDIVSSYEGTADVVNHYYDRPYDDEYKNFLTPPKVPTAQKKNVVAYLNRNCGAMSGRNRIVSELMKHYPVEAYGCLGSPARVDKMKVFSEAKFCIAMENSLKPWYVTEKIWQAFAAGCLPIYMGAPNFEQDFAPHHSVIMYDPASMTPTSLAEKLKVIAANDTLYEEYMAWRAKPLEEQSPGFQRVVEYGRRPNPECRLCMKVAELRYLKEEELAGRLGKTGARNVSNGT